ncbi:MAG: hypothetical protein K2V38_14185 [Gemmataceae bacterium]|nr:hypothetical protein [Gemmataceae bacterium]
MTLWILTGCPARTGERIKLTAVRAGGRWLVNPSDLDAFFAALAASPDTPAPPAPTTTVAQRRNQDATKRELDRRLGSSAAS